jgi:hypothetical protein
MRNVSVLVNVTLRPTAPVGAPGKPPPFVAPLVIRELVYYLLKGPVGESIRQFTRSGHRLQKISQSIHQLRSGLSLLVVDLGAALAAIMTAVPGALAFSRATRACSTRAEPTRC